MSKAWLEHIKAGMAGRNVGLPNCFDRFNKFLYGTQRATYYAIGGAPGSGKSAFTDDNFVLTPFFAFKNDPANAGKPFKVKWFYYSFEVPEFSKRSKWMAYLLYHVHGIKLDASLIDSKDANNKLPQAVYEKIEALDSIMDELFSHITLVQDLENPTGIRNDVIKYANDNGVTHYEPYTTLDGKEAKRRTGYTANDPEERVIIIVDHAALLKKERSFGTKENIDKLSEYMIDLRNMYKYTPVVVCQFNKGLSNIERIKLSIKDGYEITPILEDFKDTGNIGQDCNVALGVFNPAKYNIMTYRDYDVSKMMDSFRTIHLMKNRDGVDNGAIAMHFAGGIGKMRELPPAINFAAGGSDYKNYL